MRRNIYIGLIASVLSVLFWTTAAAQQQECCSFRVRHNFRVCLQGCQLTQVQWDWFTQASVWPPLITNINAGSQTYSVPSTDTKCVTAVAQQDCALAAACARFQVNAIPGTNCVQGLHEASGRACVRCRLFGAQAIAKSRIIIQCGTPNAAGLIQWQPAFDDTVGGECGVQNHDPVVLKMIGPGGGVHVKLFDLVARGFSWEYQDRDSDGWGDEAKLIKRGPPPSKGHVTLLKRHADTGAESRLHLRHENGIVVESENTGEFARMRWPAVGEQVPPEIPVPATFDLPVAVPSGWILEEIEMGGDGESGNTPPPPGDVNGDGCVDDADLAAVIFAFGSSGAGLPEDLNHDGIVDDADLAEVIFNFGSGC